MNNSPLTTISVVFTDPNGRESTVRVTVPSGGEVTLTCTTTENTKPTHDNEELAAAGMPCGFPNPPSQICGARGDSFHGDGNDAPAFVPFPVPPCGVPVQDLSADIQNDQQYVDALVARCTWLCQRDDLSCQDDGVSTPAELQERLARLNNNVVSDQTREEDAQAAQIEALESFQSPAAAAATTDDLLHEALLQRAERHRADIQNGRGIWVDPFGLGIRLTDAELQRELGLPRTPTEEEADDDDFDPSVPPPPPPFSEATAAAAIPPSYEDATSDSSEDSTEDSDAERDTTFDERRDERQHRIGSNLDHAFVDWATCSSHEEDGPVLEFPCVTNEPDEDSFTVGETHVIVQITCHVDGLPFIHTFYVHFNNMAFFCDSSSFRHCFQCHQGPVGLLDGPQDVKLVHQPRFVPILQNFFDHIRSSGNSMAWTCPALDGCRHIISGDQWQHSIFPQRRFHSAIYSFKQHFTGKTGHVMLSVSLEDKITVWLMDDPKDCDQIELLDEDDALFWAARSYYNCMQEGTHASFETSLGYHVDFVKFC